MLLKNFFIFGLTLSFMYSVHAYTAAQSESSEPGKTFCEYSLGDWYGHAKYDSKADVIHMQNCTWEMGYSCSEYDIEKLIDQDGIKVYYHTTDEFFINDNEFEDNWRWQNSDCMRNGYEQYGLTEYAFTYSCPYTPPKKPKQLLIIDKKDKVYAIDVSEKKVKIFSDADQPIFYQGHKALSVNKVLCE